MGFGSPWILWALAAVAIPVIIHLFYFRRYKKIFFSNIQFLQEATVEQKKSGKLRHLLILLSRILAVIFLVLAFTLPFFSGSDNAKNSSVDKVVIYIDNTFSMSQVENNRSLLDEAKMIAATVVDDLGAQQQVMILTNDASGAQKSFYLPSEAKKMIEEIRLSSSSQTFENWNLSVHQLMEDVHAKNVRVIYISDFQKNALPENWDSLFVSSTLVPINRKSASNISIDSLGLSDPIVYRDAPNQLIVKIKNQGPEISTQIHLTIQDEIAGMKEVLLPENGTLTDTLSFHAKSNGWVRGKVALQDVQLEFDNSMYFSIEEAKNNKVLLIEEVQSSKAVFQVFKSDPHFIVTRQHPATSAIGADYSLVVLNEVTNISANLEQQIIDFVQNGGNLYLVPSDKNAATYRSLLEKLSVGQYSEKRVQALSVQEINDQEPVVSIAFEKIPNNLDLPKVQSYWTISSSFQVPESSILKFENGRPFIQKYQVGKGLVYLQASSLNPDISDFAAKSVFAPIIYNFAVVKSQMQPLYYTIGEKQLVKGLDISSSSDNVLKMSSGQYEIIPPIFPMGQQISIEIPGTMERDGVYDIWRGEQLLSVIACNFNRRESEMKFFTAEELKEKYDHPYIKVETPSVFLQKNSGGLLKSHASLWKVCVILALIFLIAEILLIRFSTNKPSHEI